MIIYLISPVYPNRINPMHGIFVQKQVELVSKKNHKVVVINPSTYNYKDLILKKIRKKITHFVVDNIHIYQNHYFDFMQLRFLKISQMKFSFYLRKMLKISIKEHGYPDIVHLHFGAITSKSVIKYFEKLKIPVVITEHQSIYLRQKLKRTIVSDLLYATNNAKMFLTVSNVLKSSMSRYVNENKITVLNNTIECKIDSNDIVSNKITMLDKFVFFTASNLIKSKNVLFLVSQFHNAFNNSQVELRIAGEGLEKKRIENYIRRNDISNIILLGRLNSSEMLNEYRNSHCYVSASKIETFGITYREAMMFGKPVVAIFNDGIAENWSDEFGFLVKSEERFADALQKMVKNYHLFDNEKISNRNRLLYDSNSIVEKLIDIYSNVLKKERK